MTGPNDEWLILADPNPHDEEWPLQPNIYLGPAPIKPSELQYEPHQSLPGTIDIVRQGEAHRVHHHDFPVSALVLTLYARIAEPDEKGLLTVQIILLVGCGLSFFVAYFGHDCDGRGLDRLGST